MDYHNKSKKYKLKKWYTTLHYELLSDLKNLVGIVSGRKIIHTKL